MYTTQWYDEKFINANNKRRDVMIRKQYEIQAQELKLKASAHLFKLTCTRYNYRRHFSFKLSLSILLRMNVMLDLICMGPVDPAGAHRGRQNANEKVLPTVDSNPQPLICTLMLYGLSYPGFDESCPITVTFYMHVLLMPMYTLV